MSSAACLRISSAAASAGFISLSDMYHPSLYRHLVMPSQRPSEEGRSEWSHGDVVVGQALGVLAHGDQAAVIPGERLRGLLERLAVGAGEVGGLLVLEATGAVPLVLTRGHVVLRSVVFSIPHGSSAAS